MKSQFLKAVLAALLTMNEVAFSLPVENNEVRRREGGDESADSRDPSTAYYFRQNGRVTFDHGRVHYVDALKARTESDVDEANGPSIYWLKEAKSDENELDVLETNVYWFKKTEDSD